MGKIKYWLDKSVDYIIAFFVGGGSVSLGFLDGFPLTFIFLFALIAILISLMIRNQVKQRIFTDDKNSPTETIYKFKLIKQDDGILNSFIEKKNISSFSTLRTGRYNKVLEMEFYFEFRNRFDINQSTVYSIKPLNNKKQPYVEMIASGRYSCVMKISGNIDVDGGEYIISFEKDGS